MAEVTYDEYMVRPLGFDHIFPDPRRAPAEGLLAYGGDLNPNRILKAYRMGIFPWYSEGDPILWWSPDPRLILEPDKLKVSKSFRRVLRNADYRVTFDNDFEGVIRACATTPRFGQDGTWLIDEMQEAYTTLHHMGFAHSVEVYMDDKLVGGLYGIAMGGVFFGESMFSHKPNGSKIALKALSDVLSERGYDFVDCQVVTEHLVNMGADIISRDEFLDRLEMSLKSAGDIGSWSDFNWEYKDGR